jgi:hypothetical protein
MKKTILSFLLVGSAALAMAQQPPTTSNPDRNKTNPNNNTNLNNSPTINPNNNNPRTTNVPTTPQPDVINNETKRTTDPTDPPVNDVDQSNQTMNAAVTTTYTVNVPSSIQTSFTTTYPAVTANTWHQSGDWYVARYVDNGVIRQVSYREDEKTVVSTFSPIRKSFVPEEVVSQSLQKYGASLYAIGASKGSDGQDLYHVTIIENGQSRTEWINADGSTSTEHLRRPDDASMNMDAQSMQMQQQTGEVSNEDTSLNEPTTVDTATTKERREQPEAQPQPMNEPPDQNTDGSNVPNEDGINNASGINGSPRKY